MMDNHRAFLKIVRQPFVNAFEKLPNGESVGEFANRVAIEKYNRKLHLKSHRARQKRQREKSERNRPSKS